ncbi:MAG: NAD(P)-dependent oxidoreductase [Alphaproteobacteria bacterium]|nr:NAD(P)-dependent oxidoreductase [Alphaproteobacteria bacterium]
MTLRAGFIGLGAMGLPMAANLAKAGFPVTATDVDPAARARAAAVPGIAIGDTPAALARNCDVVFTCLPSVESVEAVYLGAGGLAAAARPGLVTAECSTIDSAMARALAARMQEGGAGHIETLLVGRPPESQAAQLYFVVSGARDLAERISPLLAAMGRAWRHVGPNGAANTIKLLQNGLGYVYAVATAEALALGRVAGVDVGAMIDVIQNGGGIGWSKFFDLHAKGMAAGRDEGWGRLYIAAKDTAALLQEAQRSGLPLPLIEETCRTFAAASAAGLAKAEFTAVARVLEARAGRTLFAETAEEMPVRGGTA